MRGIPHTNRIKILLLIFLLHFIPFDYRDVWRAHVIVYLFQLPYGKIMTTPLSQHFCERIDHRLKGRAGHMIEPVQVLGCTGPHLHAKFICFWVV